MGARICGYWRSAYARCALKYLKQCGDGRISTHCMERMAVGHGWRNTDSEYVLRKKEKLSIARGCRRVWHSKWVYLEIGLRRACLLTPLGSCTFCRRIKSTKKKEEDEHCGKRSIVQRRTCDFRQEDRFEQLGGRSDSFL